MMMLSNLEVMGRATKGFIPLPLCRTPGRSLGSYRPRRKRPIGPEDVHRSAQLDATRLTGIKQIAQAVGKLLLEKAWSAAPGSATRSIPRETLRRRRRLERSYRMTGQE